MFTQYRWIGTTGTAGLLSLALVAGCGGSAVSPTNVPPGEDPAPVNTVLEAEAFAQTVRIKLGAEGEALVRPLSFVVAADPRGRRTCAISGTADSAARGKVADCLKSVYPNLIIHWK